MAITKTHPIKSTLKKAIDYICNPAKTDGKLLVSSFGCTAETADIEFAWTRKHSIDKGTHLGRHLIQAFEPVETTPEQAHEIGMQLAKEILGGQYEFILTTHIDKGHIHNHLIFNSVSFANYHYYHSNKRSYHYIRRVSDRLCKEHGLSVIIPGQNRGKSYAEYTAEKTGTSYKAKLKAAIDKLIPVSSNFEDLIRRLQNERYEVKRGKYISCRASGQERFTRMKTLGTDYTEEAVSARIAGRPRPSRQPKKDDKRINLLIDIQNNIKAQESGGFARWAKINNLKQVAKTMNFLTEHGISSYEELEERAAATASASDKLLASVKSMETHIADISLLMKHAAVYRKLKPIYDSYRKFSDKEKFLRGHESDIILFEASVNALKEIKIEKLPSADKMKAEYEALASEKEKLYSAYKTARINAAKFSVIKQNVDNLLSVPKEPGQEKAVER